MIVLHGGPDFDHGYLLPDLDRFADAFRLIPGEISVHIARAIPSARLVTIRNCGHFAYFECAGDVRRAFNDFFRRTRATERSH
jgi:pimeloyl-ACP methyl ester carboxylesterase